MKNDIRVQNNSSEDPVKIKELLTKDERIKSAAVLFHERELLTAVRMKTFSRFSKRKIGKELEKKLKEYYPELNVTVSVDNKILMEMNKLMDMKKQEKVSKKIKKLKSLIKEET
ncbi:YhcN/YlaJ family sporulation lipoprotein [Sporosarcina limicola]|uniref:Long-subunit acyl-CoA synthetase (AMP-forming) n=1 Tax=Sporosarcina limicola TaxID=34101 RepID=A0A927MT83_9BACL|nr:YhcN/YlaJ family sporulation lipoprotein [Sporosarcina limicola]MBE1556931.1 long-subunit acyl-CoA synthetase (AMP-forming) [Sporosarcina limicola]